jgi:hypothetical protein
VPWGSDPWGPGPTEKHYASVETSYDDQTLWNRVTVTAPALADQTAEEVGSQAYFGGPAGSVAPRALTVSTLLTTTGDMLDRAETLIDKYAFPEQRITRLSIDNASLDDTQWSRILMRELHDRILVRKRPAGDVLEQVSFIEGMSIDDDAGHWRIVWNLSPAPSAAGGWRLGITGSSELTVTTVLG